MKKAGIYRKPKGQVLLVVLVVGVLTLMLLMGVAARINTGRTSIRRSFAFDRSIALGENTVSSISGALDSGNGQACLDAVDNDSTGQYINISSICSFLGPSDVTVFARKGTDAYTLVDYTSPYSLFFGAETNTSVSTARLVITCERTDGAFANDKMVVTRIYDEAGEYKVEKGITTCLQSGQDVKMFDKNGTEVTGTTRTKTNLVRVRLLDGSTNTNKFEVKALDGAGKIVGSSKKYEFMIVGAGGLGSDSIIKFEKPAGPQSPLAFDFVYFGEDIP